jgi:hypothetical protein
MTANTTGRVSNERMTWEQPVLRRLDASDAQAPHKPYLLPDGRSATIGHTGGSGRS